MDGGPASLVDRGEIGLDHVGDDKARVHTDPYVETGIIQLSDAAYEFGAAWQAITA